MGAHLGPQAPSLRPKDTVPQAFLPLKPATRLPERFSVGKTTSGHVTAFALVLKNGLNTCLLADTKMGT